MTGFPTGQSSFNMDWSDAPFFDNHPVGFIGAQLLSSSTSTLSHPHQMLKSSQNHQSNPSSPESIHSPSFKLTSSSHPKRKSSPTSNLSLALKDRKESISQIKSPIRHSSDQSIVEHTHQPGSEPFDHHHPQSKGVGKTKRKEQNRNAQRAFRERKEKRLKTLQDQVDRLLAQQEPLTNENKHLRELVDKLQTENQSLGVYKEAFTFTMTNDLRRSSMPISKSFDQPESFTSSSSSSSSNLNQFALKNTNHPLEPLNHGNQENLNRLALSLPTSDLSISNQARILQKPTPQQTPRNSISQGTTHEGYTPPLSSSSSLASFLNTNHTPLEHFGEENRSYTLNPLEKVSKPLDKFDSSFPIYTSSSMPRNPNVAFNVNQSDPALHSDRFDKPDLNSSSTFTSDNLTSSLLNFDDLLPLNDTRQRPPESDTTFWNSYLNFESPNDKLNRSEEIDSIEKIQSNQVSFKSNDQFGFQSFNHQERLSSEFNTKDKSLSSQSTLTNQTSNSFNQWRSNVPEPNQNQQEISYPIFGIQSLENLDDNDKKHKKSINTEEERIQESLIKFVDEGVLSNQELDGLCEMLESKATCQQKSELMKDVVAIRPDWIGLIEDLTRQAKSKCTEGLKASKQQEEEEEKVKKEATFSSL